MIIKKVIREIKKFFKLLLNWMLLRRSCKIFEIYLLQKNFEIQFKFANNGWSKKKNANNTDCWEFRKIWQDYENGEAKMKEDKKISSSLFNRYIFKNIWSSIVEETEGETSRACLGIMQRWINQVSEKIWEDIGRRINLRPSLRGE